LYYPSVDLGDLIRQQRSIGWIKQVSLGNGIGPAHRDLLGIRMFPHLRDICVIHMTGEQMFHLMAYPLGALAVGFQNLDQRTDLNVGADFFFGFAPGGFGQCFSRLQPSTRKTEVDAPVRGLLDLNKNTSFTPDHRTRRNADDIKELWGRRGHGKSVVFWQKEWHGRREQHEWRSMTDFAILRQASVPDNLRIARSRAAPNLGPRLLFFSGGSALNEISRKLKHYTHNSVHLITPFDSGGSSQVLREAFAMPAVGDLRSRLMALADETELGQPDIYRLFSHRLPKTARDEDLAREVASLFDGSHPLLKALSKPMRQLIVGYLRHFSEAAPDDLDYRNASIGNLILAGGYLDNDRGLEPVLFLMSKMVDVRGTVRPIADVNLQIGAELEDGRRVIGQRQMTGKESAPLGTRILRLFLSDGTGELPADSVRLPKRNQKLIAASDLICYPPGSLYSSVISNLLPAGVGRAIASRTVPKIYVPSLGDDPECHGMRLTDQVAALLDALRCDAGPVSTSALLTHVVCDVQTPAKDRDQVSRDHGIPCIGQPLVHALKPHRYDPEALCELLISLS